MFYPKRDSTMVMAGNGEHTPWRPPVAVVGVPGADRTSQPAPRAKRVPMPQMYHRNSHPADQADYTLGEQSREHENGR
jgi:hypothetical protein